MKVRKLHMKNFMLFDDMEIQWSKNINVISGENSTGKTTLLKILYSTLKPLAKLNPEITSKEKMEEAFVNKMVGVFRPDESKLGRMVSRRQVVIAVVVLLNWIAAVRSHWDLAIARKNMRI